MITYEENLAFLSKKKKTQRFKKLGKKEKKISKQLQMSYLDELKEINL